MTPRDALCAAMRSGPPTVRVQLASRPDWPRSLSEGMPSWWLRAVIEETERRRDATGIAHVVVDIDGQEIAWAIPPISEEPL